MTKESTQPVPVSSLKDSAARRALPALCSAYRDLQYQIAELERDKTALAAEIKEHAERADVVKISGPGWQLARVITTRSTIKPELLLQAGVDMNVIESATEHTSSVSYRVTKGEES